MNINTNQSVTKSKVVMVAILAIIFVCVTLVVCVFEIRQNYIYKQRLDAQRQQITELENAKAYYQSQNYHNNTARDNGYAGADDLIFGEK